jgi:hypothetical protein
MSMHLVGIDTFGAVNDGHRTLAARVFAKTISIIVTLTHKIVQEVVFMIRADLNHGRIQRDPKAWERD